MAKLLTIPRSSRFCERNPHPLVWKVSVCSLCIIPSCKRCMVSMNFRDPWLSKDIPRTSLFGGCGIFFTIKIRTRPASNYLTLQVKLKDHLANLAVSRSIQLVTMIICRYLNQIVTHCA